MDPTIQRCQRPLKAALNSLVFAVATYLLPTCSTFVLLFILHSLDFLFLAAAFWGSVYYWAVVFEAVTAYRRQIALPQAIDFSLDPPASHYVAVLLLRCFFALLLPVSLLAFPVRGGHSTVAVAGILGLWVYVLVRETTIAQLHGQPRLEAGAMGTRIKPVRLLRQLLYRLYGRPALSIPWGGLLLPIAALLTNFVVIGAVGTGKTLIVKAYIARLLPWVYKCPKWRAVVVDPKGDLADTVMAAVPRHKIQLLNFGSADTLVWDVAKDTGGSPSKIQQLSHGIIEAIEETQPFFTEAARAILQAIMMALSQLASAEWRFADVFFIARSQKRTKLILGLHQSTREVLDTYAANARVMNDVFATLNARLADFYPLAAIWSHSQHAHPQRTFSISTFVRGNSVLLIQMQAGSSISQGKFFALLLKLLSQSLLDQETGQSTLDPEDSRRTLIVIDEAPRVGKLELIDLVTNGRDYGIGILIATQSIDAMLEHYKKEKLDALMNEFHSMAFLSANSPTTLKWMAERLGNTDSRLPHSNDPHSHNAAGDWTSTLDPTQFHNLRHGAQISPNCIPGIFQSAQYGTWYSDDGVNLPEIPTQPADRPIPDDWHELRPWDDEDLARLNLTHLKSQLELASDGSGNRRSTSPSSSRPRRPKPSPTQIPRFRP